MRDRELEVRYQASACGTGEKRRMLSKYEQSNIDEDALMMAYYEDGLAEDEAELLDA